MSRVSNTKIVHEDGGVQWVLERTVGHVTFMLNVYYHSVNSYVSRICFAQKLKQARREMRKAVQS